MAFGGVTFRERLQLELAHLELLPEVLKVLWRVLRRERGEYGDKGGDAFWVRVTVRVAVRVFAVCVWVWMNVLMNVRMNLC